MDYYLSVYDKVVQQLGSSGAPKHLSKSLFAIVIGSNDIFGYFSSSEIGKEITPQQYVNSMVITLEQQLKVTKLISISKKYNKSTIIV